MQICLTSVSFVGLNWLYERKSFKWFIYPGPLLTPFGASFSWKAHASNKKLQNICFNVQTPVCWFSISTCLSVYISLPSPTLEKGSTFEFKIFLLSSVLLLQSQELLSVNITTLPSLRFLFSSLIHSISFILPSFSFNQVLQVPGSVLR